MNKPALLILPLAVCAIPTAAHAELPEPVRKMIAAAEATGDAKQVAAVISAASAAYPDEGEEIAAIKADWTQRLTQRKQEAAKRKQQAIRTAGVFERWDGKGELGALRATGNSSDVGVTAALTLKRIGIDWRHKLTLRADYQRSDGETTRSQYLAGYEPSIDISKKAFVFGLAQYERDRIQGFNSRYSLSGGLGYRIFDREDLRLEVKAGPAWRKTDVVDDADAIDPVGDSYFAGLGGLDLDWKFAKNLRFTQSATAFVQTKNSTYTSLTGIEAGLSDRFTARLSYRVEHDTDPPDDAAKTDTLSRMTLIYDF